MKREREELETLIVEQIKEIKASRKKKNEVNKHLKELGVALGVFDDIVSGKQPISSLSLSLLCLITEAIYVVIKNDAVSPDHWFTDNEVDTAKRNISQIFKEEKLELPLIFERVIKSDDTNYMTELPITMLVKMVNSQMIIYDYDTQRSAKYIQSQNGVVPTPDVNPESVKDIAEEMTNGTYLQDVIALNIYSNEVEPLSYNEKKMTLTVNEGAVISILDGYHRLQGSIRTTLINPDTQQKLWVTIRSYDTPTAQRYFGQINTINPVKVERRKELLSNRKSDQVVRDLQLKSDLKGKIASASTISTLAGQLTTFDIMSYAIDQVFNPQTKMEATEVSEYLIKFYNYLVGSYVDEFLENPNSHRESNINHPLMFIGYTVIAKYLINNDIHTKEIKKYIDKIDFRNEELNELLKEGHLSTRMNANTTRKKVLNYFETLVSSFGEE
ncbi:hypothetical protein F4V43_02180 [Paenibacillus spiritus]|uniref:DGQHR domain-containing protein n=1 Tax=Paenibacillus spiritus TaxID=2496557 RepID=A0A5J5GGP1_9BACL|nr:DNA sulfur modification protein DndB [Paenibacillus spiritus]KAA9007315.1 hypothetical protein F4V43_02180 [Paenibacillus spiritus]